MTQADLFASARAERDAALDRVARHSGSWFDVAAATVAALPRDWTGTGEDLRLLLAPHIGAPHSRNAWGALVAHALRAGDLVRTGIRRPMRTAKSHARQTDVYRRPI